jgi:hypothetical protein
MTLDEIFNIDLQHASTTKLHAAEDTLMDLLRQKHGVTNRPKLRRQLDLVVKELCLRLNPPPHNRRLT